MALASMTGFARAAGQVEGLSFTWELKSVNGRGLDLRLRVPTGFEGVEVPARKAAQQVLKRGNLQAGFTYERQTGEAGLGLKHAVLDQVIAAAAEVTRRAEGRLSLAPMSAADLLAMRGVLDQGGAELDPDALAAREAAVLATFEAALKDLVAARDKEGAALAQIITGQIDAIERLTLDAEQVAAGHPAMLRARLLEQIARVQEDVEITPERLAQEVALLASKADVREEIDRLKAHVAQARSLIGEGGAVGRRLDFLTQEFHREANTLCSKSPDIDLTRIGLELKAVIDQLKEQVQNVE